MLRWERDETNPIRSETRRGLHGNQPDFQRSTFIPGDEKFEMFNVVRILDCGNNESLHFLYLSNNMNKP